MDSPHRGNLEDTDLIKLQDVSSAELCGTLVEDRNQQKSVNVKQHPETASVQPGHSVTLQCSLLPKNKETRVQCPGEHSVYWFRAGSGQSHPEVIYTHRNSSDEQEERSCVYSLSKTIRNSSDTGTYYCAVVSCGEILFGEGTKVETKNPVVLVLGLLLACCVTVIVVLIFYVNRRTVCEHCKASEHSIRLCLVLVQSRLPLPEMIHCHPSQ
ncbi:uncharacterized protein LOC118336548 [Morone saxatilis]|uniref:uncharacterized protein LOC118336548 n=1 Tax=Morone saxatilis TaxID=34816 RepID=UPI0015E24503|nr:uncharacterized protein LOC118336548 [Morone saxatilis]